jgi:hypothetical protein
MVGVKHFERHFREEKIFEYILHDHSYPSFSALHKFCPRTETEVRLVQSVLDLSILVSKYHHLYPPQELIAPRIRRNHSHIYQRLQYNLQA